ncbi:lyase family protein [Psychrobacter arcticus]|uniref:lyase family protein n=1 Tax=Psychrobacter arcticus TaxID=334543 RepID=UPI00222607A8|nr:lyase family protein [Psychrobacter arcticus]
MHPNNHVNLSQSTNDTNPTALNVALDDYCTRLLDKMAMLHQSLVNKSIEFADQLKTGRTHLQDTVPMTAGQKFNAFATMVKKEMARIESTRALFHEINMGGTAIGTGLNAPAGYSELCAETLQALTGLSVAAIPPPAISAAEQISIASSTRWAYQRLMISTHKYREVHY